MNEQAEHVLNWASAAAVLGAIAGFLPAVAALLGCVWYSMQIWDWIQKKLNGKKDPANG